MNNDFEKAFSDFIDRREYDQAENALFAMGAADSCSGSRLGEKAGDYLRGCPP